MTGFYYSSYGSIGERTDSKNAEYFDIPLTTTPRIERKSRWQKMSADVVKKAEIKSRKHPFIAIIIGTISSIMVIAGSIFLSFNIFSGRDNVSTSPFYLEGMGGLMIVLGSAGFYATSRLTPSNEIDDELKFVYELASDKGIAELRQKLLTSPPPFNFTKKYTKNFVKMGVVSEPIFKEFEEMNKRFKKSENVRSASMLAEWQAFIQKLEQDLPDPHTRNAADA